MMDRTREELASQIDEAEWSWLRAHLERGGLVVVSGELDLVDVALKIATDDAQAIGALIADGLIGKPSLLQIKGWDTDKNKLFQMLVVSPYVLIKETAHSA